MYWCGDTPSTSERALAGSSGQDVGVMRVSRVRHAASSAKMTGTKHLMGLMGPVAHIHKQLAPCELHQIGQGTSSPRHIACYPRENANPATTITTQTR